MSEFGIVALGVLMVVVWSVFFLATQLRPSSMLIEAEVERRVEAELARREREELVRQPLAARMNRPESASRKEEAAGLRN